MRLNPFVAFSRTAAAGIACLHFLTVTSLSAEEISPPAAITINPAVTHGTWEGWGTSLAWFAKVLGNRDDVADILFTTRQVTLDRQSLPGLGLNIARYNAGASSWNEIDGRRMVVSKIIQPFRQIDGFWLDGKNANPASASWDWSVDANQRALLLKAKARGVNHFELFSNSPMWWMCANDNPSGAAVKTDDNLPPRNYPAFATYLATIAARAKSDWGVTFTSVDPFNEPTSGYWFADCKQEGTQFNIPAQIAFLPILRAELNRQGLHDLPIAASDETSYDAALKVWRAYPDETKALVSRVNVHGYQHAKGDRAGLYRAVVTGSGKSLWNSEYGDKFADGLEMARNIHRDFAALHPTAWCYWQPFDGGNNGGWGLFPADLIKGTIGLANPKFFVLAHYSRHIRAGMTLLDSADKNTVAAYDARTCSLVLVTLNDGPARTITYDLSRFQIRATAKSPVTGSPTPASRASALAIWLTEPAGAARYARVPSPPLGNDNRLISVSFPANSIQTIVISETSPMSGSAHE